MWDARKRWREGAPAGPLPPHFEATPLKYIAYVQIVVILSLKKLLLDFFYPFFFLVFV